MSEPITDAHSIAEVEAVGCAEDGSSISFTFKTADKNSHLFAIKVEDISALIEALMRAALEAKEAAGETLAVPTGEGMTTSPIDATAATIAASDIDNELFLAVFNGALPLVFSLPVAAAASLQRQLGKLKLESPPAAS